ncbi:uncharacterized protein LOC117161655 [Bombus vancouverensis nearcticus]|uniref:uncharacterized protein LOC117161655 n=1 Tax=Bombus vancouverensis nearcticus TaxID=2705178 RepID=UPI00402BD85B
MSYADVVEAARAKVPLADLGVASVEMKKAMTGAIIIRVPGDKDREKATRLATRLAEVLDPATVRVATPTRMAELRLTGIDISVKQEELRRALAAAAGCGCAEVQVGEIGATRGGLGSAWIRCPVAGARKLAQAGKIALGWSTARVTAIPKRPLQCFRCLELGHARATCVSTVDRGHLCYRMGGAACAPSTTKRRKNNVDKRRRPTREPAADGTVAVGETALATTAAATGGPEEAIELT